MSKTPQLPTQRNGKSTLFRDGEPFMVGKFHFEIEKMYGDFATGEIPMPPLPDGEFAMEFEGFEGRHGLNRIYICSAPPHGHYHFGVQPS
ncbi:hypothetical protein WJU23_05175 [Prosthecobacter sp. SYSU 5D2]|uniref:hypothetical protein n=1 Tax=Prosthecobacter sp. SYSU 5D2 TaxID=3134134 RepID=UPI0031FE6126